ncbi:lysozyme inhibitor LprI family protein [Achromobacter insuavis]|uniref:lysozyme inhibitor LprI family protein n=1 Tax=Achromobacter insuavis TaxID=1287735 RepID=UPI0029DC4B54|nr:lysozyme inhibitor LprI family protein [Achromobacter sp.]MCG2602157.1 lysozyme inhibitor LprI family protein [Achromobacter sp.]
MSLRNRAARLLCLVGLGVLAAPALAINCQKASTVPEKLICSDRNAVAADGELNRAYAAVLKQAPDEEIHKMLVDSQRRWLKARDQVLDGLTDDSDALQDDKTPGQLAADLILNRIAQLKEIRKGDKLPAMIATALRQREFNKQFTGGPYAGFDVSCDLLPRDYKYYGCFAIRHYQNNDRLCSAEEYWATGSVYVQRYVAKVVDNKPVPVASCSFNGVDANCPGGISDDAHWNTGPEVHKVDYSSTPLPKVDGEVHDEDDNDWLKACLTDPSFPLSDPKGAGR